MSNCDIPWTEDDIFHDKLDAYPLHDYFPLSQKTAGKEVKQIANPQTNETGWHN